MEDLRHPVELEGHDYGVEPVQILVDQDQAHDQDAVEPGVQPAELPPHGLPALVEDVASTLSPDRQHVPRLQQGEEHKLEERHHGHRVEHVLRGQAQAEVQEGVVGVHERLGHDAEEGNLPGGRPVLRVAHLGEVTPDLQDRQHVGPEGVVDDLLRQQLDVHGLGLEGQRKPAVEAGDFAPDPRCRFSVTEAATRQGCFPLLGAIMVTSWSAFSEGKRGAQAAGPRAEAPEARGVGAACSHDLSSVEHLDAVEEHVPGVERGEGVAVAVRMERRRDGLELC
mmetsp:Transcript_15413/g.46226  ORF Transcript_15413/g.46226 Transcript_15413/m.46226 type:complete len:281 (+) Transcript_15413:505-1347(+)